MKKLICLLLALTMLFAAALAESGLKERRPALEEIPLDDALAATEAPVESAAAEEDVENIQRALDDLLSGLDSAAGAEEDAAQPSGMVTDPRMIDLAGMDEDALNALGNRISRELERRAMEEAGVTLENGTVVVDQNGVRMTLYEDTVQIGDGALRIDATVENGSDRDLTLEIVLAEINGLSVLGYGVYNVYAGESVVDYIIFDAEGDAETAAGKAGAASGGGAGRAPIPAFHHLGLRHQHERNVLYR